MTQPNSVKTIKIDRGVEKITAGSGGAVFVYYVTTHKQLLTVLHHGDMQDTSSVVHAISGPHSDLLIWKMFGTYSCCLQYNGLPWWNLAGFLIEDHTLHKVGYIQYWTLEEGIMSGDHHMHDNIPGPRSFGEVHAHMYVGNGADGMQTTLPNTKYTAAKPLPDAMAPYSPDGPYVEDGKSTEWINWHNNGDEVQLGIAIPPGYVHGPLWLIKEDGSPVMGGCDGDCSNCAEKDKYIEYSWHRNLVGQASATTMHNPRRLMMLIAFEHPPEYCHVPPSMLATGDMLAKNVYMQSRDDLGEFC